MKRLLFVVMLLTLALMGCGQADSPANENESENSEIEDFVEMTDEEIKTIVMDAAEQRKDVLLKATEDYYELSQLMMLADYYGDEYDLSEEDHEIADPIIEEILDGYADQIVESHMEDYLLDELSARYVSGGVPFWPNSINIDFEVLNQAKDRFQVKYYTVGEATGGMIISSYAVTLDFLHEDNHWKIEDSELEFTFDVPHENASFEDVENWYIMNIPDFDAELELIEEKTVDGEDWIIYEINGTQYGFSQSNYSISSDRNMPAGVL